MLDTSGAGRCIVLFSGGRDSTVATLRLMAEYPHLVLVTVTTAHLVSLDQVLRRLKELKEHVPETVSWIHAVAQPNPLVTIGQEQIESCLPCHEVYLQTAVFIARQQGITNIALGYARYQDTWLEQTPYAIETLTDVLKNVGIQLLLPAADLSAKTEVEAILRLYGLNPRALEQKCLKQQFNDRELTDERAVIEIDSWRAALTRSLASTTLRGINVASPLMRDQW